MAEKPITPKEKYEALMKEIRLQKSLASLEKIYEDLKSNKDSLYDFEVVPFEFSENLLWFLNNNIIKVDMQFDIFKLYIDGFFSLKCNLESIEKNLIFKNIFNYELYIYKYNSNENFLVFLNRFFNIYYPKDNSKTHEVGDIMDILINEEKLNVSIYGWIQMPIKRIDKEKNLYIFEDYKDSNKEIMISTDNFKVQEKNTYVKEEEMIWRNNLKVGDKVDYLTSKKNWVEGYIKEINTDGDLKVKALGEPDDSIIFLKKYSPFIQPLLKYSFKYKPDEELAVTMLDINNDYQKYDYIVPYNEINHLVPFDGFKYFSLEYYEIFNYFINKMISSNILENENIPVIDIYLVLLVLYVGIKIVNINFLGNYFKGKPFENIKKKLLDYSLNKKKNINKITIDNIFAFSDKFLGFSYYPFQLTILLNFGIEFGYNCFKDSESLEKRLLGINNILRTLPFFQKYFLILGKDAQNETNDLIRGKLLNKSDDNGLFGLLFKNPNIHEQLLLKGVEVIKNLSKLKFLDDNDIEHLYNLAISCKEDSELYTYLYNLLTTIAADFTPSQTKVIFNKFISFPYDKIRENDINLLKNILQNIQSKEDFLSMAKTFLDYYYNYMIDFKKKDIKLGEDFGKIMSFAKDQENLDYLYLHYFEKIVNEIKNQNDLEGYTYYFILIYSLFNSLNSNDIKKDLNLATIRSKFKEIFYKEYKDFGVVVDKLLYLNGLNEDEKNETRIKDVMDIINGFTQFILDTKFYTVEAFVKLSDYFVFGNVLRETRNHFLYSINRMKNDDLDKNKLLDILFNKFDKFFDSINPENPSRYKLIDENLVSVVYVLFQDINKLSKFIGVETKEEYLLRVESRLKRRINPLELKYFDVIWKMIFKYYKASILTNLFEEFSLKNYSPSERHEIWEKIVNKIFTDIDKNIYTGLLMIENLLKISEKYGTAGVHSHLIESRLPFKVDLNLNNLLSHEIKNINIEEEINSNSTIYDIKKEIQKKHGIDPIFFTLAVQNERESFNEDNTIPLFKLFPRLSNHYNKINLNLKKSGDFTRIYSYPLSKKDGMSDKYLAVLNEVFFRYAKDNKLDIINYKKFFYDSIKSTSVNSDQENKVIDTFHKFDMGNKGYWTIDEFIIFYSNQYENKASSIYTTLNNLGYTNSLDNYLIPIKKDSVLYYEENNVKEFMPRYFIGNKKEYMSKLFIFAKNEDKHIHTTAQNILQEVCTLEEMKKTLFEQNNKIDNILTNNNLELRAYAYDILLIEFYKNDEKKDEATQQLIDNFTNNNLYKLISELDKINGNEKEVKNEINTKSENEINEKSEEKIKQKGNKFQKETHQFFSFYLSNLKIIYYCVSNIFKNDELHTIIEKFEDIKEENEKQVSKNIKIVLNEEQINLIKKLDFLKLTNAIGKNFTMLSKNDTQPYRNAVFLSIKIILYIILLSQYLSEEEKTKIYKCFIKYQIELIQSSSAFIKLKFLSVNKLLLPFMNEETDKKFILLENEEFIKQILSYETLIPISGKLFFFFKLFYILYDVSIKDTRNDELFEFFEKLLNIILDKNIELNEYILSAYFGIINKILTILKDSKYQKIYDYDFESLLQKLINDFIIIFEKDENNKITDIDKLKKYSKYSDSKYISDLYQILYIIISLNPDKYLKLYFNNDEIKNVREKHLTKLDEAKNCYSPLSESISAAGFVGIKNLSCLCYMNSVIQQFFMIPIFRNAILSLPINPNLKKEEDNDDLLFQFQKMFYYLNYSKKEHYNPKSFVFSFKDYDGKPTNVNVQCDAQEFLSRLIEKIEESLKNSDQKYLCSNIFGGTTLQQVKCTNPECGNTSERKENINYLSLDIKESKNVEDCLNKFIAEEKIEDYHCEKCDKKITNIKRVLIDKIPNILIIHLQRIAFSYETFNMEKINIPIRFDESFNIKKYTLYKDNNDIPKEYFDYKLQGLIIHKGTAQYGHYYSVIYSEEKDKSGKWYKFNDTSVTEINYDQFVDEAIGNNLDAEYGSSAYMLIYQKNEKKPVIINSKGIDENIKKILDENKEKELEKIDLQEGKTYFIYENEKEAVEKNINYNNKDNKNIDKNIIIKSKENEGKLVTYEEALDSLQKYNNESKDKKPFINTIILENIKLNNDKKFYHKGFTKFISQISEYMKNEIINDKTNNKINEYIPFLKIINDYILNIIALSNFKDELIQIVDNITDIYKHTVPKEFLSYLIKEVIDPIKEKLYINYFVSRDRIMGNDISKYVGKIVCCCLDNSIENEICMKFIQFYIDKIPVEITKNWIDMEPFNNLILVFIENSDLVKKTFIQNQMISKLIDFVLGRSSPFYQGDQRVENKVNKGKFGPIVKSIALLFKYYAENYEKEEIKLSASDLKLIDHKPFYEKVVLDDYDNNACNLLIDNKMKLSLVLNKGDKNEDFDNEIIDILIKLKIPSIKKMQEIISGLELLINLMKKYSQLYLNKDNNDEQKIKEQFLEKLNILLGLPVLTVTSGEAEIKYISGKYHEQYTILTNISKQKETNKDILPLLTSIFNLLNVNEMIFTYMDNLPAPNSLKYSYVDYLLKLFELTEKQTKEAFDVNDEMGIKNPLKELSNLINEVCKKNNKDLNSIKENTKITITESLYFNDFSFKTIKDIKNTDKLSVIEMTINYCTMKSPKKIDLPCFNRRNYFYNLISRDGENNTLKDDGLEQHTLLCILICCANDLDITINFKPYIYSKIEIKGKKECHYFLYCMDYDNEDKKIDYSKMDIDVKDNQPLALPSANNNVGNAGVNDCTMNCPVCGTANVLDETNVDFKCVFCEANLF